MKISGGTTFGNCATGSPVMVTRPTMTMIGRLMKNLDMWLFPWSGGNRPSDRFRRRIGRVHNRAFTHLLGAFDNDTLAGVKAFLNDPVGAGPFSDPHHLDMHFVFRV